MIQNVSGVSLVPLKSKTKEVKGNKLPATTARDGVFYSKAASDCLKLNSLNFARTISFAGSLSSAFDELNKSMVTCKTKDGGESVGSRVRVNEITKKFISAEFLDKPDDAIKTTIFLNKNDKKPDDPNLFVRTQIKLQEPSDVFQETYNTLFQMAVRDNASTYTERTKDLSQLIDIVTTPENFRNQGTQEQSYVLNTRGNLMAVVEDRDDVLLTNAGTIKKKDTYNGVLEVSAKQWHDEVSLNPNEKINENKKKKENKYEVPKTPIAPQVVRKRIPELSEGEGTEIIIGLEDNRFVDEIKESIVTFVEKVQNGEIVLDKFVANKDAKSTQIVMLAAGYGSRAEYTNASSSAIFHDVKGGTQSTKGIFRTATGLTPMETTFITLHKAGLLDCSKEKLGIGKNIKFYLHIGKNQGSGRYTLELAQKMARDGEKSILVVPNDSMSRMTEAITKAKKITDSGQAAIAMIAKKVKAVDCVKNFGIMRLGSDNQILEFKEKPEAKDISPEFIIGKINNEPACLTNTFQFTVSNEALKVLDLVEPFYNFPDKKKETRDWSKNYVPVIQAITMYDSPDEIRKFFKEHPNVFGPDAKPLDDETIHKAKEILHGQKLYAVPTDEPWADCGTLNQLYWTTMEIAHGSFPLEDFERAHVLSCVDTNIGLVASSKEQKDRILKKYDISGQVMVVPQASVVNQDKISNIPVTENKTS